MSVSKATHANMLAGLVEHINDMGASPSVMACIQWILTEFTEFVVETSHGHHELTEAITPCSKDDFVCAEWEMFVHRTHGVSLVSARETYREALTTLVRTETGSACGSEPMIGVNRIRRGSWGLTLYTVLDKVTS